MAPALPRGVATREHTSTMQRFRRTWLALMGGALLVTLSISTAFGAAPAGTRDATRGQTIAALVHGVVFDTDAEHEDEPQVGDDTEESAELDEEETDAANGEEVTDSDEEEVEADSHGTCVSEVARDKSAVGGKNGNHGGAVSEAARVTCREGTEEAEEKAEASEDTEAASDKQALKAEEQAATFAEQDAKQAEKASHAGGKPSWAGNDGAEDNGKGGGNGRGGDRP